MTINIPQGPVMVDVAGLTLTDEEIKRLQHPLVGGVILFARSYQSTAQLAALTAAIHAVRNPALIIAVDHEGGRVQRFREGFTAIPPMRILGTLFDRAPNEALDAAKNIGMVIASELMAYGVDFSFTPVLDLDWGASGVIGNRAFHARPEIVATLAGALIDGLASCGMASVGKHYPGHGFVKADSHLEIPVDERDFDAINKADLIPFRKLSNMTAVMPAHVIYPKVDAQPAGFSKVWLQDILREQLQFDGVIFSDDLSMEGASVAGDVTQRAHAALDAGCDMVLLCNDPMRADELLAGLTRDGVTIAESLAPRLARMAATFSALPLGEKYRSARDAVVSLGQ